MNKVKALIFHQQEFTILSVHELHSSTPSFSPPANTHNKISLQNYSAPPHIHQTTLKAPRGACSICQCHRRQVSQTSENAGALVCAGTALIALPGTSCATTQPAPGRKVALERVGDNTSRQWWCKGEFMKNPLCSISPTRPSVRAKSRVRERH